MMEHSMGNPRYAGTACLLLQLLNSCFLRNPPPTISNQPHADFFSIR
jgi:hypothetical protein